MSARRVASHLVTAVAILMMVGSGIWIVAAKMAEKFEELIPGGFILWTGIALARFGRRLRARSVDEVLASDPRRPVVYLRSFGADAAASRAASDSLWRWLLPNVGTAMLSATEEEQLVKVLGYYGPVIAIGRPGELLPRVGAAREYVEDPQWQATVTRRIENAELVVLRAGETPGIRWELALCVERLPPERLIVLTPKKEHDYDAFRGWAEPVLTCTLPPFEAGTDTSFGGVLAFDREWVPQLVPVKVSIGQAGLNNPVGRAFGSALGSVLGRKQTAAPSKDAGWSRRLAAAGLDYFAPPMVAIMLGLGPELLGVQIPEPVSVGILVAMIAALVWMPGSFLLMVPFTDGGTLGQRALGIRLVDCDSGQRPSMMQTVLRFVLTILQFTVWPVTLLAIAGITPFLPDYLARTRVVWSTGRDKGSAFESKII